MIEYSIYTNKFNNTCKIHIPKIQLECNMLKLANLIKQSSLLYEFKETQKYLKCKFDGKTKDVDKILKYFNIAIKL